MTCSLKVIATLGISGVPEKKRAGEKRMGKVRVVFPALRLSQSKNEHC